MSISVSQIELTKAIPTTTEQTAMEQPELVIKPRLGWIAVDWRELWSHRELLYFLIWRDVKVRYKQAILGVAWAVLAPIISVALFTFIFGNKGGMSEHLPAHLQNAYSLYIFAALIPWLFVSQAISVGGMSLVNQQHLLNKIYMPRLFIPAASIGSALVDACISFGVFFVWMTIKGVAPSGQIVFLPLLILLTVLISLGIAFTLSAATVCYRDLRFLIPFITQLGMWVSAVVYPPNMLGKHQWLLMFNPLFAIFDGYRSAIFGMPWKPWHLLSSIVLTLCLVVFGLFYFRKTERRFADIA